MDIQTKKLHFVQELKEYSQEELEEIIDSAESDFENGKLTSARELKGDTDSWN